MQDKILFISDSNYVDYMSDVVFHGGRTILGENFIDAKRISFMYDDFVDFPNIYGRGFTLYGKLNSQLKIDRDNLEEKIKDKYFKFIIYGSCLRNQDYLDSVKKHYKKDEVVFIDGEDHPFISFNLTEFGLYFKRELDYNPKHILPIQFAIPEESIIKFKPEKTQNFGTVIPYEGRTYVFNDEESYFEDYAKSYFGVTCKKAGWDCLRHYEIMMNYCFPYFKGLEECPKMTMTKLPKKQIIMAMRDLHNNCFNYYDEFMEELMYILINKLTTKKIAEYVLNCL